MPASNKKRSRSPSVNDVVAAMSPSVAHKQDPIQDLVIKQVAELERIKDKYMSHTKKPKPVSEERPPKGKAAMEFSALLHDSLTDQSTKSPSVIDMLRRRESIPVLRPSAADVSIPRVNSRASAGMTQGATVLDSAFARNFTKFFD